MDMVSNFLINHGCNITKKDYLFIIISAGYHRTRISFFLGWNVVLQHTSMVGPAIHNKSPIYYRGNSTEWTGTRARVAYKVPNEDAWIIGAQDGGALKMVKIQVTGANTYRWIRTKYRYNVCSTEVCINQEYDRSCIYKWFNESCFDAGVDNSNAYHVLLVAKKGLPQSSHDCAHHGVKPMGESCSK